MKLNLCFVCLRWAARNSWHQKWCPYLRAQLRITTTSDVTCGRSEWSPTSCYAATRRSGPTAAPTAAGSAARTAALVRSCSSILSRRAGTPSPRRSGRIYPAKLRISSVSCWCARPPTASAPSGCSPTPGCGGPTRSRTIRSCRPLSILNGEHISYTVWLLALVSFTRWLTHV